MVTVRLFLPVMLLALLFGAAAPARAQNPPPNALSSVSMHRCVSALRDRPVKGLYPPIPDSQVTRTTLRVSASESVYIEVSGNPKGKPILFLHGGPGVGVKPSQRQFFDPAKWRIFNIAQRGSPPNPPRGDLLKDNTVWDLIRDLESFRMTFGVEKWTVFGGSWGSTLALAYAETHPEAVEGLILRGIYLARPQDSDWYFHQKQDPNTAWPEWKALHALVDPSSSERMDGQLLRQMLSPDRAVRLRAKRAWLEYGDTIYDSRGAPGSPDHYTDEEVEANPNPVLESAYGLNGAHFPTRNYLIENIGRIRHIPAVIIHGMSDRCTPVSAAVDLSQVWPEAEVILVPGAGHGAEEPGIVNHLIEATDRFAAPERGASPPSSK